MVEVKVPRMGRGFRGTYLFHLVVATTLGNMDVPIRTLLQPWPMPQGPSMNQTDPVSIGREGDVGYLPTHALQHSYMPLRYL